MAGFVDVLLRGLILVLTSVALGGVAWLRFVLRAEAHVKPDAPTALALRTIAAAATGAALAQAAVVLVGLTAVADAHGGWPLAAFFETTFALTATARVILAVAVAALALRLAHHAAPRLAWTALTLTATLLVASSAVVSHAVARVTRRLEVRDVILLHDADFYSSHDSHVRTAAALTLILRELRQRELDTVLPV